MWLLNFLPNWIFYSIAFLSAGGLLLSKFIPQMYRAVAQLVLGVFLLYGVYMIGGIANEEVWQARVDEMEQKVAEAEVKSVEETVKIVTKVKYKTQIIHEKGDEVIKYIDREIVKYDVKFAPNGVCEIPKEFISKLEKVASDDDSLYGMPDDEIDTYPEIWGKQLKVLTALAAAL